MLRNVFPELKSRLRHTKNSNEKRTLTAERQKIQKSDDLQMSRQYINGFSSFENGQGFFFALRIFVVMRFPVLKGEIVRPEIEMHI